MKTWREQGCESLRYLPREQWPLSQLSAPADEVFSAVGRALTAISSRLRDPEKLGFVGTLKLANAGVPGG